MRTRVSGRDFREIRQKQKEWGLRQEDLSLAETSKSPAHGAEAGADFELHMIQICKPEKAAKSLAANPESAVLMPKFVMAFSKGGTTQLRFLSHSGGDSRAVVADGGFPGSLANPSGRFAR